MFRLVMLEEFGKAFIPKKLRPNLRKYLLKAGISPVPYNFFGALFYLTAVMTAIVYMLFVYSNIRNLGPFMVAAFSFLSWTLIQGIFAVVFILTMKIYVDFRIYYRTKELEAMLPDFLQVLSSNIKGGMPFEHALWASIKPRFKIFANEMAEVSKRVMTGHEIKDALVELSEKYDSPMLKRSIDLIISEIESGGNIAKLIDKTVENMKNIKSLKEDMAASALSYVIFIGVIIVLIAPLLFALSYTLLTIISNFIAKIAVATKGTAGLPINLSEVSVDLNEFKLFSIAVLVVISFFSSLIVSIVEKGEIRGGIKYLPLFILGSVAMYFLMMFAFNNLFIGLYNL